MDDLVDRALDDPSPTMMRDTEEALGGAYTGAAHWVIKPMNLDQPDALLLRTATEAVDYAHQRAAEMVGKRYDEDGNLVDNPNADWAITDTLRNIVRAEVRDAVATDRDVDRLADHLVDTGAFSDYRAEMIARTEINMAMNQGVLAAGRQARALGLKEVQKVWTLGDNPCEFCQEAAAQGVIGLDEDFEGEAGDAPPLHPNCECSLELFISDRAPSADAADAVAAVAEEDEVAGYDPGLKTPADARNSDPRNAVVEAWATKSPNTTMVNILAAAPDDQRLLEKVGTAVANDIGALLKTAGHKVGTQKGIDRVEEKAEKKYSGNLARVSDVTRMTLVITHPEQADRAVEDLSQYFEVAAEPFKPTDVLYADRALNVRLPDGTLGEVQIMDEQMAEAKAEGHKWFKIMQDSAMAGEHPDRERYIDAYKKSREIYQEVIDGYDDDWKAALGELPAYNPVWKARSGNGGSGPSR